jgi:hypothetical protein
MGIFSITRLDISMLGLSANRPKTLLEANDFECCDDIAETMPARSISTAGTTSPTKLRTERGNSMLAPHFARLCARLCPFPECRSEFSLPIVGNYKSGCHRMSNCRVRWSPKTGRGGKVHRVLGCPKNEGSVRDPSIFFIF